MARDQVARTCFERVLPRDVMRYMRPSSNRERAIMPIGKRWMNGSVLHVRFLGGNQQQRATAREQAQWWTEHANLTFVFDDAPTAEIRIAFDEHNGAWSYLGTDILQIPPDEPTMNLGFLDGGTAGHEFGHAIGLAHEHQNPAGGIEWNEPVVIADLAGPPNFWDEAKVRHNVLEKYSHDQVRGTQFDGESIMLYFFPGSWVRSGVGTEANEVLSAMDKAFIGGALAYPKEGPTPSEATVLTVGARKRTAASIGAPGEEDLFQFTVDEPGRHVVDTRGSSDLVMKLFGPGSATALIAEDDDSGYGLNPRVTADLVEGQYWVQVRHYNQAEGTGTYSIRARRA
ncbi:MAG: M12 family metallopeptidase [Candidatus Nanopelagicales bacterium]|jgi:hypothetical protein|nr:M12 family metallopeptidase [Candidatus Nanopelagicales bacterium]